MVDAVTGAGTAHALRRDIELAAPRGADARAAAVLTLHLEGLDEIRVAEGPEAADAVVKAFAEVAPFALHARDRVYRSGPSEMIVLMPGADRSGVVAARSALEASFSRFLAGKRLPPVTLSVRSVGLAAAG